MNLRFPSILQEGSFSQPEHTSGCPYLLLFALNTQFDHHAAERWSSGGLKPGLTSGSASLSAQWLFIWARSANAHETT